MPCSLKHSFVSKKLSTSDALISLAEKIRCNKNEKKITEAAFSDLSKAFASINYELMIQKLSTLGLLVPVQNLVTNYFSNRTQNVIINHVETRRIEVAQEAPQGTVLGHVKQYNDTVLLGSHDEVLKCKDELEEAIEKCIQIL